MPKKLRTCLQKSVSTCTTDFNTKCEGFEPRYTETFKFLSKSQTTFSLSFKASPTKCPLKSLISISTEKTEINSWKITFPNPRKGENGRQRFFKAKKEIKTRNQKLFPFNIVPKERE